MDSLGPKCSFRNFHPREAYRFSALTNDRKSLDSKSQMEVFLFVSLSYFLKKMYLCLMHFFLSQALEQICLSHHQSDLTFFSAPLLLHITFSLLLFLSPVSNFKAIVQRWGRRLFSPSSVVIGEVEHINHTFVFHLTETLLRKMEISSWQRVCALFLFQAVLFSWFYFSPSHSRAPTTSVVWFGLESRERWREGRREGGGVCVCVCV